MFEGLGFPFVCGSTYQEEALKLFIQYCDSSVVHLKVTSDGNAATRSLEDSFSRSHRNLEKTYKVRFGGFLQAF